MRTVRARNSHKFSSYSRKTRFSLFPFLDFQKWKWACDLKMEKKVSMGRDFSKKVSMGRDFSKKVPVQIFFVDGSKSEPAHWSHDHCRWVDIRGDKFENRNSNFKFQIRKFDLKRGHVVSGKRGHVFYEMVDSTHRPTLAGAKNGKAVSHPSTPVRRDCSSAHGAALGGPTQVFVPRVLLRGLSRCGYLRSPPPILMSAGTARPLPLVCTPLPYTPRTGDIRARRAVCSFRTCSIRKQTRASG
jgi:hypothetical protein